MKLEKLKEFEQNKDNMTLEEYLSLERTHLSVERTHLSYMRTVVSMIVAGITLFKLVNGWEGLICTGILLLSATYFYIRGKKVCNSTKKHLRYIEDEDD